MIVPCSGILERCETSEKTADVRKMYRGVIRKGRCHYSLKVHIVSQNKSNYSENLRVIQELIGGDKKCPQTLVNTGVSSVLEEERKTENSKFSD